MKGFVDVTDNEWFAYLTLLKQDWPKAQGLRLTALRSNSKLRGAALKKLRSEPEQIFTLAIFRDQIPLIAQAAFLSPPMIVRYSPEPPILFYVCPLRERTRSLRVRRTSRLIR